MMADITMCVGTGCTRKDSCYRHTAGQNPYRQSFFVGVPLKEDGDCVHFWCNGLDIADKAARMKASTKQRKEQHNV